MDVTADLKASFHYAISKGITDTGTGSRHISRGVRPSMCLRTVQVGSALDLGWKMEVKRKWRSRARSRRWTLVYPF